MNAKWPCRRRHGAGPSAGPHSQRGAAGLFAGLLLMMMLLFAVVAMDTGRLVYAKSELRKIADMAALDAASQTYTCNGELETSAADVAARATAAARAQSFQGEPFAGDLAAAPNAVRVGRVETGADFLRRFTPTDPADADAVEVIASKAVPGSLLLRGAEGLGSDVTLSAEAIAHRPSSATLSVGSYLASLDSTQSALLNAVLGGLLGGGLALDALHYEALASVDLSLLDLIGAMADVGTVEELLGADVSVENLLNVTATALDGSQTLDAAVQALNLLGIAASVGNLPSIQLGDILNVAPGAEDAALNAHLNALDLVTAAIMLANQNHLVDVPGIGVNLGPLAQVDLRLHVIEPPQIGIGPPGQSSDGEWRAEAHSAQIQIELVARALELNLLGLIRTRVELALFVQAAPSYARVETVECGGKLGPSHIASVRAYPGLARVGIGTFDDIGNPEYDPDDITPSTPISLKINLLGLGEVTLAEVSIAADAQVRNANPALLDYEADLFDPQSLPQTRTLGSSVGDSVSTTLNSLLDSLVLDVDVLLVGPILDAALGLLGLGSVGELVQALLSPLVNVILDPLLGALDTALLDPLLALLGLNLGGADISLVALDVGSPQLLK